jgi:hypothetical protein
MRAAVAARMAMRRAVSEGRHSRSNKPRAMLIAALLAVKLGKHLRMFSVP